MRVLILYKKLGAHRTFRRSVQVHLHMLDNLPHYECLYWNVANGCPRWLGRIEYDVIVLHTTFLSARYGHQAAYRDWRKGLSWISNNKAIKIAFPQDERYFSNELCRWLQSWNVDLVYSPVKVKPCGFSKIYQTYTGNAEFLPCLTGYIDDSISISPDFDSWGERRFDLVYRAKTLPLWVGRYGNLKRCIYELLDRVLPGTGLRYDISADVRDTKFGLEWIQFLHRAKLIVGAEAGGSGLDGDGSVTEYVIKQQGSGEKVDFNQLDNIFPGWDGHDFLVIGPRHLEAAASGTCQILVEGEYSGWLKPGRHYIPIKEDLSNLEDVIQTLDWQQAERIARCAWSEIAQSPSLTYSGFAAEVDQNIQAVQAHSSAGQSTKPSPNSVGFILARQVAAFLRELGLFGQLPHLTKLWIIGKWDG